jgi:hypothetical protein
MRNYKTVLGLLVVFAVCALMSVPTSAQSGGTVATGTTLAVRTNEEINVFKADGRVFSGAINEDVRDSRGQVAIPRGTYVEMLVKRVSDDEYALDLESISVNGTRMAVQTDNALTAEREEGIGANSRTGRYVGGGAVIGAIIGAITGGKDGAAIGGAVGAGAGAGAQVLTRGQSVKVPSESLVTFRLQQPLVTGVADRGFSRNGIHYHEGFGTAVGNTPAYEAGLRDGRSDRNRNRTFNSQTGSYSGADLREYQEGYERGFDETPRRAGQATAANTASVQVGADRYVTWTAPANAKVYVQVDNNPRQLFASGASGSQPAPWIRRGSRYVFIVEGPNGRELARDVHDLTTRRSAR